MLWTLGGVTAKNRCMSASAGGRVDQRVHVDESEVLALLLGETRGSEALDMATPI
jgi:hypothetical protein